MKKRANKNIQWAGIDTRNLGARSGTNNLRAVPSTIKQQFYADFGSVIDEWWSLYQNQIHINRNGVKAKVKNGDLSIEMKSDLTVYIGGSKKRFGLDDSLYEIILWVDQQNRNKFAKENTMTLRKKLIRLAYENPSLREDILPLITKSAKGGSLMTRLEAEQEIKKLKKRIKSLKKKEGDFAHRGAWNNFRAKKIRPLEQRVIEISDDINTGNLRYAKKGDYKKGDKIPSKAVYGGKDSYDEKLKDGKIFVVLPRGGKNSDPYMMYLTDKSLKVLKVLGTHPTMRGAKSWLKSQKGKLASVRRGETWENNNLRVHRYHDSLKVWDLKHAGKRGKNVEIMHIDINDWEKPNPKRAYLDDLANFLTKSTTYDKYKKLVISFLETAGFSDVVGGRNSVVSFTSEKGVRISPPNMGKIVINNRFVSAYFELDGFHIQDKTDQNNLPTMMERDRRSPKKLYKMVAGNKELFERMNYKEMYQFLKDYKIKFRVYMGMD